MQPKFCPHQSKVNRWNFRGKNKNEWQKRFWIAPKKENKSKLIIVNNSSSNKQIIAKTVNKRNQEETKKYNSKENTKQNSDPSIFHWIIATSSRRISRISSVESLQTDIINWRKPTDQSHKKQTNGHCKCICVFR